LHYRVLVIFIMCISRRKNAEVVDDSCDAADDSGNVDHYVPVCLVPLLWLAHFTRMWHSFQTYQWN